MFEFQDLERSEEFFKTLTEESPLGICIIQDEMIKYANSRFSEIFGFQSDKYPAKPRVSNNLVHFS